MDNKTNFSNRTIFCLDNLPILRAMNSNCVNLIYLDPPFNKKKEFTAPIGSSAEGAGFKDIFTEDEVKDEWVEEIKKSNPILHALLAGISEFSNKYNYCYATYMAIRLIEIYRVLTPSGAVYLHCDATMSHYLKLMMDCIFGEKNFRNEIIWCYSGPSRRLEGFTQKHDVILYYAKSPTHNYNPQRVPHKSGLHGRGGLGFRASTTDDSELTALEAKGKLLEDWWHDITPVGRMVKEVTGYPTQKPLALLERIIKASSNEGDLVLDPFCGCATACVAAERLGRRWAGIDVSHKAYELVKERLGKEKHTLIDWNNEIHYTQIRPKRSDGGDDGDVHGFVYIISNPSYPDQLKIGISKDPEKRLNGFQTSDPNRGYKIEKIYQTKYNAEIESMVHHHYQSKTEWVDSSNVAEVYKLIISYEKQLKEISEATL